MELMQAESVVLSNALQMTGFSVATLYDIRCFIYVDFLTSIKIQMVIKTGKKNPSN